MASYIVKRMLIPVFAIISVYGKAQSEADQKKQDQYANLKAHIDSKQYSFIAQSATTMKGKTIQLGSGGYFLKLNQDSLLVDLPYYGRGYSADYAGSSDMGIRLNTTNFSYAADTLKKGGWNIIIKKIQDSKVNTIYISVSASGYSTVRVNSNNRDPISFYGTITGNSSR
jgi:hypothetical protein